MTGFQIPDEAVQAAKKAVSERCKRTYLTSDQMFAALAAALPHLSAPCAVEVVKLNWQIFCSRSLNREAKTTFGDYVIQNENGVWRLYLPHQEDPHSEFQDDTAAEAAAQADFERRILTCVVTKPVDVAAVREECAEVVENAVLSYHVADCAGLADWKAFEKGQESGLKFGAAAIRALSPTEPVGRATLAQGGGE